MDNTNSSPVVPSTEATPAAPAQGGASSTTASPAKFDSNTEVSSMGELKAKAPKVYDAMLQGLATQITTDMKDHQDRLKEMADEYRRESGQS